MVGRRFFECQPVVVAAAKLRKWLLRLERCTLHALIERRFAEYIHKRISTRVLIVFSRRIKVFGWRCILILLTAVTSHNNISSFEHLEMF